MGGSMGPTILAVACTPADRSRIPDLGLCEVLADRAYADILIGGSRSSGSGHTYGLRPMRAS